LRDSDFKMHAEFSIFDIEMGGLKNCFVVIIVLFAACAYGQNEANNWYFGHFAGIDFSNACSPQELTNGQANTVEGSASISDANGNLLFYVSTTGGSPNNPPYNNVAPYQAFDANHNLMPNGTDLEGHNTSTQGALIIPDPGSSDKYYVFTVEFNGSQRIFMSRVDMTLNGGLGDVDMQPIAIDNNMSEKITAVQHANGTDFWIFSHKDGSDNYAAYLLTAAGIQLPVTSSGNISITGQFDTYGQIKASPNGTKVAMSVRSQDVCELCDFDQNTGLVSNCISLVNSNGNDCYGNSFSPDGTKLYVQGSGATGHIIQYDLNAVNIATSGVMLGTINRPSSLQLAPDGKIYFARADQNVVGVINCPNELGLTCNMVANQMNLSSGISESGLPNFWDGMFYDSTAYNNINDTVYVCVGDSVQLAAPLSCSYTWSPASGLSNSTVQNPWASPATDTTYTVLSSNGGCSYYDTIRVVLVAPNLTPEIDTAGPFCTSDLSTILTVSEPGGFWSGSGITNTSTGQFDPAIAGIGTHAITYTIPGGNCTVFDVTNIIVFASDATIMPAGPFCENDPLFALSAVEPSGTWSGTGITDTINGIFDPGTAGAGTHTITYSISGLCADQQTITIVVDSIADATITPVGPFCPTVNPVNLTGFDPGGLWSGTGITDPVNGIFDPVLAGIGLHTITYTISGNCGDQQTLQIEVLPGDDPSFTYSQVTYCFSDADPTPVIMGTTGGSFNGSNGVVIDPVSGIVDIAASGIGTYDIEYVTNGTCPDSSIVQIVITNQLDATITAAGPFCENAAAVTLSGADPGGTWSGTGITDAVNGTFDPVVAGAGTHTVTYSIGGNCADTQTIDIVVEPAPAAPLVINDTICIGDTIPALMATGGAGTLNWYDDPAGTNLVGTGNTFTPPVSGVGTYTYYVSETVGGCTGALSAVTLTILSGPTASFIANPTNGLAPLVVDFTNTSSAGTYDWVFGDGNTSTLTNPTNTYVNWGTFTASLTVIDSNGCVARTSINIVVGEQSNLYVPNVVSINNDGDNDSFYVTHQNLILFKAKIFNRWGQFLYDWTDPNGAWDGTTPDGEMVPEGTYYYIIYAIGSDGVEYDLTGHLTLIR
jgi:gliding motility-associated-like protein